MQILLHNHVAASSKGRILAVYDRRLACCIGARILRAGDKAQHVAVIKIAETMPLVGHRDHIPDAVHNLGRQFKAQVYAFGSDMEENVARRGDGMTLAGVNLPKQMKLGRPRRSEELVPGIRPESRDAGKTRFDVTKLDSPYQS